MNLDSIKSDGKEKEVARLLLTQSKDFYEFIAFVFWYVFLILCCVVPTACAYRRRRNAERLANATIPTRRGQGDLNRRENFSGVGNGDGPINAMFFPSHALANDIRNRRPHAHTRLLEEKRDYFASKMATTKTVSETKHFILCLEYL